MKCSCGRTVSRRHKFCTHCGSPRKSYKYHPLATLLLVVGLLGIAWFFQRQRTSPKVVPSTHSGLEHLPVRDRVALVDRLIASNSLPAALMQLDALLAQFPKYRYGKRLKAHLLRDLGDNQAAEAVYREYLAEGEDPRTQLSLARVLAKQDRFAEAATMCRSLLQQHPTYADAHDLLSRALEAQGEARLALQHRETAQQLRETNKGRKPRFVYLERYPDGVRPPRKAMSKNHPSI